MPHLSSIHEKYVVETLIFCVKYEQQKGEKMKKLSQFLVLVLFMQYLISPPVFAEESQEITQSLPHCGVCERAESVKWTRSWWGKIERGLVNAGLGWGNLFAQPTHAVSEGDNILKGIGKGFEYTGLRTIQGVVEILVFWLPPVHDEPLKNCALGDFGITGR